MPLLEHIRFGAYVREITMHQEEVSYNEIVPEIEQDQYGNDLVYRPGKLKLRSIDVYRLVHPYFKVRLIDQVKAVLPLAIYLILFQLLILRQNVTDSWVITAGLMSVIIGLMFFIEGLKVGLMPFGETIGNILPSKAKLPTVLLIAFMLGIGVTFAEPAIGALKAAGALVSVERAPYLYSLLNSWSAVLVLMVGMGVGLAAVLGTLSFIYGWSLKPLIYMSIIPTIGLTLYIMTDNELSKILGLAWDCGAVTTGPVTVPLVLSLGIGIATAAGKGRSSLSGFGIVTLASLFPIIAVQILAIYISFIETPEMIINAAASINNLSTSLSWHERTPYTEILSGIRAIIPLVLFLIFILLYVLKEKIKNPGTIAYGISLSVIGMIIFNVGLSYGLSKLGGQSGGLVPGAFTKIELISESPLYNFALGITIALAFAWVLGFGATLAEPALNALGMTVENLTNGAFRKELLMHAVSFGVGCGIAIGIFKIIYSIPIAYIIIPGYLIAIALTYMSTEEFVNIAWDSAGVTTGPITVPLVLAMGLGFGEAVGAIEGFGILSMASIGPIISVMTTGLLIQWKIKKRREHEDELVQSIEGATHEQA